MFQIVCIFIQPKASPKDVHEIYENEREIWDERDCGVS
jgi:hypothetical protein